MKNVLYLSTNAVFKYYLRLWRRPGGCRCQNRKNENQKELIVKQKMLVTNY